MLSSAILQIIAIVAMTIDHIGLYFVPDFAPLRIIGRLAFPLFALLLLEGFRHTHSRPRYFARLLIFGLLAQLPTFALAALTGGSYSHNVLFTLDFALLALMCAERGGFYMIGIPLLGLAASALNCDYGVFGVFLIVGFYYADLLFSDKKVLRAAAQLLVLFAMMQSLAIYHNWNIQYWAIAAIVPIALYSGKKGRRLPRLLPYFYFPAHLFAIYLIKLLLH